LVKKARLGGLTAALYLINFDDDGHRSTERATFFRMQKPQ